MKPLLVILKSIGVILLGFVVIVLVNSPHDLIINTVSKGTAKNNVPAGTQAELISIGIVFLAGVFATIVVYILGGQQRKKLLVILVILFLLADLTGVFTSLAGTSLFYRIVIIVIIPLEVWVGFLAGKKLKPA